LPTVIVDVGNEYMELVDRVVRSSDDAAETRLLHAGQHAMPAILARFPGPVRLDVSALPEGALPRAGECGPVLRLIARQRRVALPFVLTLVDEPNADRRFWATYLLSELPYVEAIEPAGLALFDVEARVRLAARTSVRILGDLYPTYTVDRLARVLAEPNQLVVRRVIAIQMLGEVRDPASVPHLLPRLVDPQPEVAAAARESLTLVSRQDFGLHLSHWNEWFDQNRGKQRVEWLIDALAHPSSHLRLSAVEELVKLTRNAFGYQDEMPKRERERVMQKFRDWWAVEGRARYGR
jgi:HEAT repeat protein